MSKTSHNSPVLVTGGSGYIASWIIRYLLEEGYVVHTTVRDLTRDHKKEMLFRLSEQFKDHLKIFKADLLDKDSFIEAMQGCEMVLHTASPFRIRGVKNAKKELIRPALLGTRNVLKTVDQVQTVERVVLTSSVAAVYGDNSDIKRIPEKFFSEENWNTSSTKRHQPYSYSKTIAEREAWDQVKNAQKWDLVVLNPGMVLGPSLTNRSDSTSIDLIISLLKGKYRMGVPNLYFGFVDVRDVAKAHIAAITNTNVSGRHILVSETKSMMQLVDMIKEKYKGFPLPPKTIPKWLLYLAGPFQGFSWRFVRNNINIPVQFDNSYAQNDLGITFRPPNETLYDQIEQLLKDGLVS